MNLPNTWRASKFRYRSKKGMMRGKALQPILFLFLTILSASAQVPTAAPEPSPSDQQSPPLSVSQTPALSNFNGSGSVDKLVPGVIQISLLDAIDRGIKH